MAMGHNLWLLFGVDEHPFATYFDVHQGYRVLTHSHMLEAYFSPLNRIICSIVLRLWGIRPTQDTVALFVLGTWLGKGLVWVMPSLAHVCR